MIASALAIVTQNRHFCRIRILTAISGARYIDVCQAHNFLLPLKTLAI
jgi:hypothetical protein